MLKQVVLTISLFVFISPAYASSSSVEIHNSVSSTSNSSSSSNCYTSITTETNGEITHYESENCGNVSANTENGETEIKENGQTVTGTKTIINETPILSQVPSPSIAKDQVNKNATSDDVKNRILEQFKRPFRIFLHIFGFFPFFRP